MIAYIINELDIRGGTHKQFLKLLEYTERQNEEFFIITTNVDFDKTYPGFRKYGDRIRILEKVHCSNPITKLLSVYRNSKKLKNLLKGADVVNIHDCGFELYNKAFKDIPTVWQINDLPHIFRVGVAKNRADSLKDKITRKLILRSIGNIDRITVNVSKNADRVKDVFHRDADVLYCGIEPLPFQINIIDTFARFREKKLNLLSSGVWFPYRNYETQVKVVKALVDKGYDVKLDIIGSTNNSPGYLKYIESLIREENLMDRITIHGMVNEDKFAELHRNADIFLFINVDQSWGLAVFEAMSCGIPVIVSNSVGATEILHDGVDSIFVNPLSPGEIVDRIIQLTANEGLYKEISSRSSDFYHAYTWDKAYSAPMFNLLKSIQA